MSAVPAGYKQTEVGVIPGDWTVKPLGSILSKGRLGGNYANRDDEAEFPLMKMGNIGRGHFDLAKVQFIAPGVRPDLEHRLVRGDVLFNTRNTLDLVGKVAMWRDELPVAYYNSNLMRFEFDPQEVCSGEYANSFLNTAGSVSRLRGLATGTTSVAAIYTRDLMGLPFAVPPLPEQRAIAAALSDVDALLAKLDQFIAKKRALKQAAMQQLLTGQTRLPGFSGAWEVKRLKNILSEIGDGATPSTANPANFGGPIAWVVIDDIKDEIWTTQNTLTENGLKSCAAKLWSPGTLILSTGATIGEVGIAKVSTATKQGICGLVFDANSAVTVFMKYWFAYRKPLLLSKSQGSSIKEVRAPTLVQFPIELPTVSEQTAIATVLSDMDTELAALEARRDKTRALKQGMMQELLTGRIRLV